MQPNYNAYFPEQRVSATRKAKADWYANCIDYIIDAGISFNDRSDTERKLNILHGNIPDEFYRKTLNPYNATKEKYKRFPAVMRNFDIMNDIIRRYVSEYYKGNHEFVVSASNPEIVLKKEAKLRELVGQLAQQAFQQEFQARLQQLMQQAQEQGQDPSTINPQEAMPDPEEFIRNFNEKYIDDESKQAQDILDYVRANTEDTFIYLSAFFDYCSLGEAYSYTEIRGSKLIKEHVPTLEAYPIPNSNFFVEDHDMFARKIMMSYQQIMDTFGNYLTDKDRKFLETYYARATFNGGITQLTYSQFFEFYADVCDKFGKEERELFRRDGTTIYADNNNLFEVWHVVWRGEAREGVLTYINEMGFETTRIVDESYKLNPEMGDISIEWEYKPQVYEGYRIGHRHTSIYPIKARPVLYNREGKLPYNGIMELLPMMGKFSIIKLVTPYQVMRNIISYHREMVIAKNKLLILLMPQSLIADDEEDKLYKLESTGVLYINDEEDTNSLKAQQVRLLNASMGDYINQLTQLLESLKMEAREMVDMNMQRYGDIAQSAGMATTQEAIARSSMGMVIITQMFDEFRKRDYNRDLDFAKLAYIDGLQDTFFDFTGTKRYISLDVNSFIGSQTSVMVRNSAKELDKLEQLRQWAFSAAQNGDLDMALAAITGDNVAQIKDVVMRFNEIKRQHEEQMQQMEQMLKQEEIENKLREIQAKGEEDRKTEELKYYLEMQLKAADVDLAQLMPKEDNSAETNLRTMTEQNKAAIERDKLNLERQKLQVDLYNKAADRQVKREDIANQLKIARTNKNKYDK